MKKVVKTKKTKESVESKEVVQPVVQEVEITVLDEFKGYKVGDIFYYAPAIQTDIKVAKVVKMQVEGMFTKVYFVDAKGNEDFCFSFDVVELGKALEIKQKEKDKEKKKAATKAKRAETMRATVAKKKALKSETVSKDFFNIKTELPARVTLAYLNKVLGQGNSLVKTEYAKYFTINVNGKETLLYLPMTMKVVAEELQSKGIEKFIKTFIYVE